MKVAQPSNSGGSLQRFSSAFTPDPDAARSRGRKSTHPLDIIGDIDPGVLGFFRDHAYSSYDGGLLRLVLPWDKGSAAPTWELGSAWQSDWPGTDSLVVFAYDWLGRLYGADRAGSWGARGRVVRLSPGAGEIEASDVTVSEFLFEQLPLGRSDVLSEAEWTSWLRGGGRTLAEHECVGYRIPLFLGGRHDAANLEIASLRVYLSVCGQLASQLEGDGRTIANVSLRLDE